MMVDAGGSWQEAVTQITAGTAEHQRLEESNRSPAATPAQRQENEARQDVIVSQIDRNAARFADNRVVQGVAAQAALRVDQPEKAQTYADRWADLAEPGSQEWANAVYTGGVAASKLGDYPKAEAYAKRVLEKFPGHPGATALYQLSKGRGNAGSSAAQVPSPSPIQRSAEPAVPNPAVDLHLRAGQTILRVRDLERHVADANMFLKMQDKARALKAAEDAVGIDPGIGFLLQTKILAVFKDFSAALVSISKAIEAFAGRPERQAQAYAQRAAIRNNPDKDNKERNPQEALKDAGAALLLDEFSALAMLERGKAKKWLGDPTADADLRAAIDRDPGLKASMDDFLKNSGLGGSAAPAPASRLRGLLTAEALNWMIGLAGGGLAAVLLFAFFWGRRRSSVVGVHTPVDDGEVPSLPRPIGRAGTDDLSGRTVDGGKYRIVRMIDRGGMGTVYLGHDLGLERDVAIKCINDFLLTNERECDRFVKEGRTVAKLKHPNIVAVYAFIRERDLPLIVFEHIKGSTLHNVLNDTPGRRLPIQRALNVLSQVASAVDYAHGAGVVHRDLKPPNVMLDGEDKVWVTDFGIARVVQHARATRTETVVGTPGYMAPEQNDGVVVRQSDVYALGIIAYEMLTGMTPFREIGPMQLDKREGRFPAASALMPSLPAAVDAVFKKVLDPDPEKRYPRCRDFVEALDAVLRQATPPAA